MTHTTHHYDEIARGYARWWAPVIAPQALTVLDDLGALIRAGATSVLDVGTGTGTLAIEILRRWPQVRVTAIDASGGMIEKARAEARRALGSKQLAALDLRVAVADDLGLPDASVDVAVSSFVLQLVPNRFRALREVHRVLRPGGTFAWISWLTHEGRWRPDDDFDAALEDAGEERREWTDRPGDLASPQAAAAQMRRAGFADVSAERGEVHHPWAVDELIGFLCEFDEEDLVENLPRGVRARFDGALRRRLEARRPEELTLRQPTVRVRGTRR